MNVVHLFSLVATTDAKRLPAKFQPSRSKSKSRETFLPGI